MQRPIPKIERDAGKKKWVNGIGNYKSGEKAWKQWIDELHGTAGHGGTCPYTF